MSLTMPLITIIQPSVLSEEQAYIEEWTNSSRFLYYSVISIGIFTLPAIFLSFLHIKCQKSAKNVHFLPYLSAISMANFVHLGTILFNVIVENTVMVYDIIPGYMICKLTAFSINTFSCFIHWAWVAMYAERFCHIFFPFRFRRHSACRTRSILTLTLLFSMCIQLWTPIFITERRLDSQFDNIYCAEDPAYQSHFQLIMVLETFTTFFLPLMLTILADISVLTWKSKLSKIEVSQEEIQSKNNEGARKRHSHLKIVSSDSLRSSQKRRSKAIRRCLISATVTLLLNLPNYCLQLLDEFCNIKDSQSIDVRRIYLRIDAFVYILYLIQFLITPFHIFYLTRIAKGRQQRRNKQTCWTAPRIENHHYGLQLLVAHHV